MKRLRYSDASDRPGDDRGGRRRLRRRPPEVSSEKRGGRSDLHHLDSDRSPDSLAEAFENAECFRRYHFMTSSRVEIYITSIWL